MNGAHDLGGMDGFGAIEPESEEPVFHAEWERRTFALTLAMGVHGLWNIDMSRQARERMNPVDYLRTSYYEQWLHGLETLLVEHGLITREGERAERTGKALASALTADRVTEVLRQGRSCRIDTDVPARFGPGDQVVVRNLNPQGHTRAPRYIRCKRGAVVRDYGVFVFPDSSALGQGPAPQHVYSVRFTAAAVWGPDGAARDSLYLDLWDDYLDSA